MINQKDVTIIIPHLGANMEQTEALIECLISLEDTVDCPIIVVTNGLNVTAKQLGKYSGLISTRNNMTTMHLDSQGQCKAVNAAAATVNTPWIFVSNDDMIYAPGWFERLVDFESFGKLMCISPKLVEPRKGAPTFIEYFCGGAGGDFDKMKWLQFANEYRTSELIETGFNLPFLISKKLWDTIGGYDINYDPWGSNSDSDLEYKIKLAGVQPYQNTNCVVYHYSQTSGTFLPENNEHYQANFAYFKQKWGFDRTDDGIWEATFKIPTVGEGRVFTPDWEGKYDN